MKAIVGIGILLTLFTGGWLLNERIESRYDEIVYTREDPDEIKIVHILEEEEPNRFTRLLFGPREYIKKVQHPNGNN